ncbi:MAG: hypothetical protein J5526_02840 [Bacteroidales bacterium]|nr:hypothetical protein [Bacteroidales bacterium]
MPINIKPHISFIFFLLMVANSGFAQFHPLYNTIVTVYSPNGLYYAKSTPAANLDITTLGRTDIYDSRSSQLLYSIPLCLTSGKLFVSNDGQYVLHLLNYDPSPQEEPSHTHSVTLYHGDSVFKQLTLREVTGCNNDSSTCLLFYDMERDWRRPLSRRDSLVSRTPTFALGDSVFIFTAKHRLACVHLPTGRIETRPFETLTLEELQAIPEQRRIESKFNSPRNYTDDESEVEFAKRMGMVTEGGSFSPRYKYYYVRLLLRIDRSGHAEIVNLENRDSLPEAKIRQIVSKMVFDVKDYPDEIEIWHKTFWVSMRKRDEVTAKREGRIVERRRQAEYKRRLEADTIDGIYIPRNLQECFNILDTLLYTKDRLTIRAQFSRKEMSKFHFGLGLWMRNNWGLWGGSRLNTYMKQRGVYHPDDMSGTILEFYYDHLHSVDSGWRRFDTTLVPPPPPDTATCPIPRYRVTDRGLRKILNRGKWGSDTDGNKERTSRKWMWNLSLTNIREIDTNAEETIKEVFGDSLIRVDGSEKLLTFERLTWAEDWRPTYGYVRWRGRYFLLTDKEIDSRYFKKTSKTHRFWKPRKYASEKHKNWTLRVYLEHDSRWVDLSDL